MFKCVVSKKIDNLDYNSDKSPVRELFSKYDADTSESCINLLEELYACNFTLNISDKKSMNNNDEPNCNSYKPTLAYITNFESSITNFLIGILRNGTAGIIVKEKVYKTKELIFPSSRDIDTLCGTSYIMNNADFLYSSDERRWYSKVSTNIELIIPDKEKFNFTFKILSDLKYGTEVYDGEDLPMQELRSIIEDNISIINEKLSSDKNDSHIGDFMIGINSRRFNEADNFIPAMEDEMDLYIREAK